MNEPKLENQFVRVFDHIDLAAESIVLMRDAIMQGFANNPIVILRNRNGKEAAVRHVLDGHIADTAENGIRSQQQGACQNADC